MHLRTLLAAASLAAAGCADRSTAPPEAPPRAAPPLATGTLRISDQAGRTGPVKLADLEHLQADATYAGDPGAHSVRLDVTGPAGTLFTQLSGTMDAGPDGRAGTARRLEVRGTPIDGYHLVGAWRFVFVVDGSPLASATIDVTD
jgi:hypothetical protein